MKSSSLFASAGSLAFKGADGTDLPSASAVPPLDTEDQDEGDLAPGVDEDALNEDELDTDQLASRDE